MLLPFKLIPMMQGLAEIGLVQFATQLATTGFNPLSLFRAGEQGVWYDPSDLSTLFQDSAGTAPVTASGQPVGLMLDKSKGLVLGPEAWPATGHTLEAGWSSPSAGVFQAASAVSGSYVRVPNSLFAVGKIYETSFECYDYVSGSFGLTLNGGGSLTLSGNGVFTTKITAGATPNAGIRSNGNLTAKFRNISVRELPGNHATQPTAASRPIYRRGDSRGVVNLLTWSEDFSNAAWAKSNTSPGTVPLVTANYGLEPGGMSMTADRIQMDGGAPGGGGNSQVAQIFSPLVIGQTYTYSIYMRSLVSPVEITLFLDAATANRSLTSEWQRITFTRTATSTAAEVRFAKRDVWSSPGTADILVWGAQLNLGPTALPYQRNDATLGGVATGASTDLHWLETDGVDDGMATGSIDFTGTDKVSVFAGVRKLSDAARGFVLNHEQSGAKRFALEAPGAALGNFAATSGGSSFNVTVAAPSAPSSAVVSTCGDISGDKVSIRLNGASPVVSASDQGTGNFSNNPLYLFRFAGSAFPFNGWFYGMAITGRLTTDAETVATERFLAAKSAVVIP